MYLMIQCLQANIYIYIATYKHPKNPISRAEDGETYNFNFTV